MALARRRHGPGSASVTSLGHAGSPRESKKGQNDGFHLGMELNGTPDVNGWAQRGRFDENDIGIVGHAAQDRARRQPIERNGPAMQ